MLKRCLWKKMGSLLFILCLSIFLTIAIYAATKDYLFLHNNDSITLYPKNNGDPIDVVCYSISESSKIVLDKGAGVRENITIKNSDGWKDLSCGYCTSLTIKVKEDGTPSSDSDLVVRIDDSKVKATISSGHNDIDKKGQKCSVCKKVLTW
ncbi:MAG: hypothetical protein ACE14Q_09410 [Acidobacteriota bacterium]